MVKRSQKKRTKRRGEVIGAGLLIPGAIQSSSIELLTSRFCILILVPFFILLIDGCCHQCRESGYASIRVWSIAGGSLSWLAIKAMIHRSGAAPFVCLSIVPKLSCKPPTFFFDRKQPFKSLRAFLGFCECTCASCRGHTYIH